MRRKEFSIEEQTEIETFLEQQTFGYLSTAGDEGWPHVKPLNFVYQNGHVYFHGSRSGEKMRDLKRDSKAVFTTAREFALIPSYFTDDVYACPATSFFKSVQIRGHVELVEDLYEKANVFERFMRKLQPEGGYMPFDAEDPGYAGQLKAVALMKLIPVECTAKFKFGQNKSADELQAVMNGLAERGLPDDQETVEMMKKYCPHHQGQG
ncbi:flavin-nucleotide-binding protein [Paenibacillus swuensis]|uniref:Flavin-nucleotide-binding protein n=1 Tax=Paenibacillus swuensis TaxID=1178515 RepID=A0A172TGF6_9BACL|nr:pyridoxamine 5'-phosphate oxidase family protein [Paenibacillus swuensis]ANE46121.1 flavin-nucleotide-binding protein [Paenibacillus swuensis]